MKHLVMVSRIIIIGLVLIMAASCNKDKVVSFRSLLIEMADPSAITRFPDPYYRLAQFSSYDRRSVSPETAGWFANNDYTHFIREEQNEGRHEYVMLESDGPGSVVRWWMTFGNENAMNSYLRVYIDGASSPVFEGRAPELVGGGLLAPYPLSSSVSPLTEPQRRGYNLYLPIPFNKSCKITLENDSVVIAQDRRSPSIYYNIDVRLYEQGTRVVSIRREMPVNDSLAIRECCKVLAAAETDDSRTDMVVSPKKGYPPGSACELAIEKKGQAVRSLRLRIEAHDTAAALRNTRVRISFDDNLTVDVPAGNFFGTGYSLNEYRTHFSAVGEDGTMVFSRLMPFREKCHVSFLNESTDTVHMEASLTTMPYAWGKTSMYFGASLREYLKMETAGSEHTGGTGKHFDLNFARLTGKGIYSGDALLIFNTADAWWGEGDEKIYVDSEKFPSSFGTGTEDYMGYAWSRPETFSHPLIAQPAGDGNFHPGMSVNMRYRVLDAIPFKESIKADIEMWHWAKTIVDYYLTSYYYILP